MKIGETVKVSFDVTITDIHDNLDSVNRSFFSGNVDLGQHERIDGRRNTTFVAGIPISAVQKEDGV